MLLILTIASAGDVHFLPVRSSEWVESRFHLSNKAAADANSTAAQKCAPLAKKDANLIVLAGESSLSIHVASQQLLPQSAGLAYVPAG